MKIKRILSIILLFIFLLPTLGCYQDNTLDNHVKRFVDDGILVYNKVVTAYGGYDSYYELCGQVDLVLPNKVYVPPFFDGKPVNVFGSTWRRSKLSMSNDGTEIYPLFNNVRSVYLPYTMDASINEVGNLAYIKSEATPFVSLPQGGPNNIFFVNPDFTGISWGCFKLSYKGVEKFYFAREDFNIFKRVLVNNEQYSNIDYYVNYISDIAGSFMLVCANTTYYFNYENNPNNGIFFINDFERGCKIENTPYEPLREGYKFAGWYKEPECINAWDFEKDALPVPEYYQDGKLKFVETKLYAKWEKGNATINPSKPVIKEELGTKVEYIVENNTIVGANNYVKEKVTELEIPSEVNGIKITAIGDLAFAGLVSLRKVTISDGVEKIGNKAFAWCDNLSKVQIPETVIETGEGAFKYCISLKNVNLPKQIKEIKKDTFSHCEYLADIQLPDKLEKIEKNAFRWCLKLKQISIPDSVTDIGDYAFFNCCNLESVDFGANIIEIGNFAFRSCRIERLTLPNNLEEIGDYAFSCGVRDNSFLLLPETLKEIGSFAFDAGHWTEVVIPKQVSIIRKCAFFRCNDLKVKCEAIEKGALWDEDWRLYKISPYDTNDRSYFEVEWGC